MRVSRACPMARAVPEVARYLEGRAVVKEIYVPGRIINIVTSK
ncbi:hypothetical protein [Deinococcus petrolearius]|uniref:Uncharacterized protein n=1 Tax=Deinococcus petrolearius TaxID=1751295 RepID=A0ABW1DDY8_9DEIO